MAVDLWAFEFCDWPPPEPERIFSVEAVRGQAGIDEPAPHVPGALAPLLRVAVLTVVPLGVGLHETPERVRGEADGECDQRDLAERVVRELRERALAARRRAPAAERELDRQGADEPERETLCDEPGAGEHRIPARA
jgi:hypothetical protein